MTTNVCIGMKFQNEAPWLSLHLPTIAQAGIDIVFLDGGSEDDSRDAIRNALHSADLVYVIENNEYVWPTIHQHNKLLECCTAHGYDGVIILDPDELMFPNDLIRIANLLDITDTVHYPTYNFSPNRYSYVTSWYPDPHYRAWRLDKDITYLRNRQYHSGPNIEGKRRMLLTDTHLYHYGWAVPPWKLKLKAWRSKAINAARKGELPLAPDFDAIRNATERNAGYPQPVKDYDGEQPMHPPVNVYAPWNLDKDKIDFYINLYARIPRIVKDSG